MLIVEKCFNIISNITFENTYHVFEKYFKYRKRDRKLSFRASRKARFPFRVEMAQ